MPIDLTRVPQLARNLNRLAEIAGILAKYGLAEWLDKLDARYLRRWVRKTTIHPIAETTREVRIRLAFIELGTTFIKLGQMLSTRRDLVGPALANELSHLQANVPPDPYEVTKATVERELGKPIGDLFARFEELPMASASIGQAHRATLLDGREVVVKVQHPNLAPRIDTDLSILTELAKLAEEYLSDVKSYRPVAVIADFHRLLVRELDFRREMRHLQIFNKNFARDPLVKFPTPVPELSTGKVLTMEYLAGTRLSTFDTALDNRGDGEELAARGARAFLDMIFRDGFYHADPHPGNLLILPNGVIGILDAGMTGRVDDKLRGQIAAAMVAVLANDAASLTDLVMQVGEMPPHFEPAHLQGEIAEQLAFYWGMPLDQFNLAAALDELTEAIRRYQILLPPQVALLLKVVIMLEGTARVLNPAFNLAAVLEPYRKEFVRRRLSPKRMAQRMLVGLRDWDEVLSGLPRLVRDVMQFARRQHFAVQLQHQHLEPSVNRLVFGLLTSSLFVGSSLLWAFKAPPVIEEISVFGVVGYAISIVLGYRLFRAIQHSGKLEEED